ncbi:hybrid sensor histidine kinase/response regulator [Geobacillus subterraneus]|uniref:hybrid sensor histidine kinase/response regulator n=1 Tax=Geobacillus subterraneus TaxID=129338 RepID=UPI0016209196
MGIIGYHDLQLIVISVLIAVAFSCLFLNILVKTTSNDNRKDIWVFKGTMKETHQNKELLRTGLASVTPADGLAYILACMIIAILVMASVVARFKRREALQQKKLIDPHYKCLMDYNPHFVLSADLNGGIIDINSKAMEILQLRQEASLVRLYDLFYECDHKKLDQCLRKVKEGQSCFLSAPMKISQKQRIVMEFTFIPIMKKKNVIGLFMVGRDVTAFAKYQARIKKMHRDLWNAICQQQGMIFKFMKRGDKFVHTLCGGELLYCLGIDPKQVLGKALHDFLPKQIADQKERYYRHVWETGEALYYEGNINGIDYLASLRPIKKNGKVIEVVGSAIDITERKMMEQEIRRAKEEAERANQAKSNLISRMSHEIRTPLNGVLGFAQLLEMDPSLKTRQREFVQEILGGARHLLNLINEMLDLARIETGRLSLTYDVVRPDDIIKESMKLVEPLANKKNIDVQARTSFSGQVYLYTDATRVRQVLLNLLDNAIKYNRDGGTVLIEGKYDQEKVVIHVKDNGIGIPDEEQENIFEPFYRIKGTHVDGNGIGLAFVKQIIRLLDGTIEVKSKLGVGSDFSFTLPAISCFHGWPHSSQNKLVNQERLLKLGNKKILYIEDHVSNLKLLEHILKPFPNLLLTFAHNGSEGLQKAISGRFDLIVIDIHLPDISGYTVLEMLQSDERTKHIPVIALSANAVTKEIERALQAGFTDYMTKPLEVNVFLEKLIKIWEKKGPRK